MTNNTTKQDNIGVISVEELKVALNGVKNKLTEKYSDDLFSYLDSDDNGNIPLEGFIHMWTKYQY
jgi:Ca2+-binding EF-hand superfamily protein